MSENNNAARQVAQPYITRANEAVDRFAAFALANAEDFALFHRIGTEKWKDIESQLNEAIFLNNEKLARVMAVALEEAVRETVKDWRRHAERIR